MAKTLEQVLPFTEYGNCIRRESWCESRSIGANQPVTEEDAKATDWVVVCYYAQNTKEEDVII